MPPSHLFTRSDLERAARLALTTFLDDWKAGTEHLESAVAHAVSIVAADSPPYYDESTVKQLLQYVARSDATPEQLLEEALAALRAA